MLQQLRRLQTTPEWKARYERRVVEGTISQGTRGFGLRRSRYMGEAKAHLQHILTASAINLVRFAARARWHSAGKNSHLTLRRAPASYIG